MKRALIVLLSFATFGFILAQQDKVTSTFQMVDQWLKQNNLTITTSPEQAFINDYILVVGEGLPKPNASTPGQKRLTAERAAEVLAYRRLAEMLEGVAIVGDTLVKDAELQYDVVRAAVAGFVKGAEVVYKSWDPQEEVATVILRVGMSGPRGFASLMYERVLGDPKVKSDLLKPAKPEQVDPQARAKPVPLGENYDGLIVDATGVNFRPALFNRIFTPRGSVLYDPSKVSQNILVEYGAGEYTNTIDRAKVVLEKRGVKNPLIVKAVGTLNPSDLLVSEEDASRVYSADQRSNFLANGKVAFVLR